GQEAVHQQQRQQASVGHATPELRERQHDRTTAEEQGEQGQARPEDDCENSHGARVASVCGSEESTILPITASIIKPIRSTVGSQDPDEFSTNAQPPPNRETPRPAKAN
ncbi:MAG: hypothetical protein ACK55I_46660, partial [bacterium]